MGGVSVPTAWEFVLLALASYRVLRLLSEDTVLDGPRRWVLRLGTWREEGDDVPDTYRSTLGEFVRCAWCLGFHVAILWWVVWEIFPHETLIASTPFALSAVVGFLRVNADPPE